MCHNGISVYESENDPIYNQWNIIRYDSFICRDFQVNPARNPQKQSLYMSDLYVLENTWSCGSQGSKSTALYHATMTYKERQLNKDKLTP